MKEVFNLERATVNASNDIIQNGYDSYFNTGIRFGFFEEEEKDEVLESIIANLKEVGREDVLELLTEKIK